MDQDVSKKLDHIEELVGELAAVTAKNFALVTEKLEEVDQKLTILDRKIDIVEEKLGSKVDGLQRAIDSDFERQSALETRISKVEEELRAV